MERYTPRETDRERGEDQKVRILTDEAVQLAPRFERVANAVYQALTNHRIQGPERGTLFRKIMSEIARRKAASERADQRRRDEMEPGPLRIQPGVYKDAMAHQMRQPRDAWDTDAEEEVRGPISS